MRGAATTWHSSATATAAGARSLGSKKVFFGSTHGANGRGACLGDSGGADASAKHAVSSGVANARDYGTGCEEFAADRNGLAKLAQSPSNADSDCGVSHEEFAACRNGLAKLTKCCPH